jgi:hypothetical protein
MKALIVRLVKIVQVFGQIVIQINGLKENFGPALIGVNRLVFGLVIHEPPK